MRYGWPADTASPVTDGWLAWECQLSDLDGQPWTPLLPVSLRPALDPRSRRTGTLLLRLPPETMGLLNAVRDQLPDALLRTASERRWALTAMLLLLTRVGRLERVHLLGRLGALPETIAALLGAP